MDNDSVKKPVPAGERALRIIKSFERGILQHNEASRLIFEVLSADNVAEVFNHLPDTFADSIKDRVRRLPTSPWDWKRLSLSDSCCGVEPVENSQKVFMTSAKFDKVEVKKVKFRNIKPIADSIRAHFKEQGIILERPDPTPVITMSFEEILKLHDQSGNRIEPMERKLSEAVAEYVFTWRRIGAQWERPKGDAADLVWIPSLPPTFASSDNSHLPMVWSTLCSHPWVYRDADGRAERWANVFLTTYPVTFDRYSPCDSVVIIRENGNAMVPEHTRRNEFDHFEYDAIDCANAILSGRNFRIEAMWAAAAMCRALLVAKKCRQEDRPPDV